jgi:MFS family permease
MAGAPAPVHFVPLITSVAALLFAAALARRWRARGGTHLAWWCGGMVLYAAGTITESITTLFGWSEPVFRAWYIAGALLGGAPLAQGTAYLMLPRRTAHRLTAALAAVVAFGATAVLLSPLDHGLVEPHRLSGRVLEWSWVRGVSPFVNLYAVTVLAGGAALSAVRFRRRQESRHRYLGNVAIAIGAVLPGIGGTFTRFGHVEVLYVTELAGLAFIWAGYRLNTAGAIWTPPPAGAPRPA